jgi:hypothetical protein
MRAALCASNLDGSLHLASSIRRRLAGCTSASGPPNSVNRRAVRQVLMTAFLQFVAPSLSRGGRREGDGRCGPR